jgi:uncharacterized membrane protein
MATDVSDLGDTIGSALGRIAREATQTVSRDGHGRGLGGAADGALSGMRGIAAGAVLAAAAPLAARGAGKAVKNAVAKRAGSESDNEGDKGTPGVGKGRRMPVQQAVDIGVPVAVAYDQWTQFEEWPQFMHRLDQVNQEDPCTVSFKAKVWGISKEFVAEIVEQRPDERIQWNVTSGLTHNGVVTFHELAPRLTRVQISLDVEPGSLIEKAARGMRHVKRAVRGDLARFKAFVEMQEEATGAWRGTIREGKVVKEGAGESSSQGDASGSRRSAPARSRSRSRQHAGSSRRRSSQ